MSSVVTSTTVVASAHGPDSPASTAARAPMASPATCENGSSSPLASRTRRAQRYMAQRRHGQGFSSANQHIARTDSGAAL